MNNEIRFGTYNVGLGWNDYAFMLGSIPEEKKAIEQQVVDGCSPSVKELKLKKDLTKSDRDTIQDEENKIRADILGKVETVVAERLSKSLDVISLQEVKNLNRPFVQTLVKQGFTVIPGKTVGEFSTAIAVRKDKFFESTLVNISRDNLAKPGEKDICGQESAIVMVQPIGFDQKLTFSSLHSWGFKLYNPDITGEREYSKDDENQMARADRYVKAAILGLMPDSLMLISDSKIYSFFAADMNNNPQNYAGTFDTIKKEGYQVLEPDQPTNVNCGDLEYPKRKIDFVFAPTNFKEEKGRNFFQKIGRAIASIFFSTTENTITPAKVLEGFSFNPQGSCSDHLPVGITIKLVSQRSLISRIFGSIYGAGKSVVAKATDWKHVSNRTKGIALIALGISMIAIGAVIVAGQLPSGL